MTEESLDDFLHSSKSRVSSKCFCCRNAEMSADISRWLDYTRSGETEVPLQYLFDKHLLPKYGKPRNVNSVRTHITTCLRRDVATGKSLEGEA